MAQSADANIGFTLTAEGRSRLIHILDAFAEALPKASSLLTDKAGRIVEIARKPLGVDLEAIAALTAGCEASTNALARSLSDGSFSLLFEHDDDQQVFVWPVADRALLVILLKGSTQGGEQIEQLVDGQLGKNLAAVIQGAREPIRSVPPPRIDPHEIPSQVSDEMRALTAQIMDLQAKRGGSFTQDINDRLLREREDLVQAINRKEWDRAHQICEGTRRWLATAISK